MTLETVITLLAIAGAVAVAFPVLRRFQAPKTGTRQLAMAVWAAFGPYATAQDAEDGRRRASQAVFGPEGIVNHEDWIQGHVKNFRDWEAENRLEGAQKLMRWGLLLTAYGQPFETACQNVRERIIAQGLEAMEGMNRLFLEEGGHRMEAVKQPDGTLKFVLKQLWSDEEIRRKKEEDAEAIVNAIGRNLLADQSHEAQQLPTFLSVVAQTNGGGDLETPRDVGLAWLACMEVENKHPDSELAQTFKLLSKAWTDTIPDDEN